MTPKECESRESHAIWGAFQHKFTLLNGKFSLYKKVDLGKYKEFFKLLLEEILKKCFAQKIYVVELRHIAGLLFDDDHEAVPLEEELSIF